MQHDHALWRILFAFCAQITHSTIFYATLFPPQWSSNNHVTAAPMAVLYEHISFIFKITFPSTITPYTKLYRGSVWSRNETGGACGTEGGTESYMQSSRGET